MDDSKRKDAGAYASNVTESGPVSFQAATDSDTGSSSSSSQAAVGAWEASEEGSTSASESDDYDEEDTMVQNTIKRYLAGEINAEAAVNIVEAMANPLGLWYNVLRLGGNPLTDQDRLVDFCREVLSKKQEDEKQWHDSVVNLKMASREEWDEILGDYADVNDVAGRPRRRALNQFFARLNAAGITNDRLFFDYQFTEILEPHKIHRPVTAVASPWIVEQLRQLADYFEIAGAWMKSQFDVVPSTMKERWKEDHVYTEKRWKEWRQRLIGIAEATRDDDVRENARAAVKAMEK